MRKRGLLPILLSVGATLWASAFLAAAFLLPATMSVTETVSSGGIHPVARSSYTLVDEGGLTAVVLCALPILVAVAVW